MNRNSLVKNGHICQNFFEPDVQLTVQSNKEIFEPDGDAINEALESLRNFDGIPCHSYDTLNDQANEDIGDRLPDESDETDHLTNHCQNILHQIRNHHLLG